MHPTLLRLPLWPAFQASWPVLLVLVGALIGLRLVADRLDDRHRRTKQLLRVIPPSAFIAALVTFVKTPIGDGTVVIPSFGVCITIGTMLATWVTARRAAPLGIPAAFFVDLVVVAMVAGMIGAKINYLLQYPGESPVADFRSGFVFYGGMIAGIAAGAIYTRMKGKSVLVVADLAAPSIMLAQAFGRLGCFLSGCCHGLPGTGFPCVSFPPRSPASIQQGKAYEPSDPVHPTQLYEAAAAVAFFFLLSWWYRRPRRVTGEVFLVAAMLYAGWRFLIEFVRGDPRPLWLGNLSFSQVVSIGVFGAAAIALILRKARSKPQGE